MSDILSRRDFLKLGALAAGEIAGVRVIGNAVGKWVMENHPEKILELKITDLSAESKEQLSEITRFRKSLGLVPQPLELESKLLEENKWDNEPTKFSNDLPVKNYSYGMYMEKAISQLFGKDSTRLVKGAKFDPFLPPYAAAAFVGDTRYCLFPDDLSIYPIDQNYIDVVLHEAGGHGSDPSGINTSYPRETLIHVEHGKWLALSQMFKVPDQFMNHPEDQMYPLLKKEVGKTVGFTFVKTGNLFDILDGRGQDMIGKKIKSIAHSQGKKISELKFNKKVCREIGQTVVSAIFENELTTYGDLMVIYNVIMEHAAGEIYAEMFKYSILYPETVNEKIRTGISEILNAINKKGVNLEKIKESISKPDEEILGRYFAERPGTESDTLQQTLIPVPTLTPEEEALMNQQQQEVDEFQTSFDDFVYEAKLPGSLYVQETAGNSVQHFADVYSQFNNKYPGIIFIDIENDDSFDPENLHLWELRDIAYALDPVFILVLLELTETSDQVIYEINGKTAIIEKCLEMDFVI